ncbi:hypothetical protein R3P38DRAFT_992 [Favolaschia claudopus]|uniref:Uncharacterized protein n=1 Tax=Favolaschia claudopus TaxID=2862362 RepID=A0AAW0EH63_9AGAR
MQAKYPKLEQDPSTKVQLSTKLQLIMAICICAEQTFSEGSAKSQGFVPAFENAMEHYVGSEVEKHVLQEYHESSVSSSDFKRHQLEMVNILHHIILNHPLRISPSAEAAEH